MRVPFGRPGLREDAEAVRAAVARVLASSWYILGPEVDAFEAEFADVCGARHAVGVGSGTDALSLVLKAIGVGAGDEVITTPLSAAYTALAIVAAGARPVFADIDAGRMTIDPASVERLVTPRTRAILPVHLYGCAADMRPLERIAQRHDLAIVEDCCQAHGATADGRPVGTIGIAGAFSFYPTKNLGALGDGGAVVTNDAAIADRVRRLRNGGQTDRYHHVEAGVNSRLDELQAAILRARLPYLPAWTATRRSLAVQYRALLRGAAVTLLDAPDDGHVYHLFVVLSSERANLQRHLASMSVESLIHYPVPIPDQPAFADATAEGCPRARAACQQVLSLPLHPGLTDQALRTVVDTIASFQPTV